MSEAKTTKDINEGLTWAGKLFFTTLATNLANDSGRILPMKIKATPEQIKALAEIILTNKEVQDELKKPGASVESVYMALYKQVANREKFKSIFGQDFPL